MARKLFGFTGNMGSGKSTVAALLAQFPDIAVFDADAIAKEILRDPMHRSALETILGTDAFEGGVIVLAKVGVIFTDTAKRQAIEQLLHPLVWETIVKRAAALSDDIIAVVESAIIFEKSWENRFDGIIVATASEAERLRRLITKRNFSEEEARKRFATQLPNAALVARADIVIDTECCIAELTMRIRTLHEQIISFTEKGKNHV